MARITKREFLLTSIVAMCVNAFHFCTGSLFRKPNFAPTTGLVGRWNLDGTSDYVDGKVTGAFSFSRWLNAGEVSKLYRGEVVCGGKSLTDKVGFNHGTIINAEE